MTPTQRPDSAAGQADMPGLVLDGMPVTFVPGQTLLHLSQQCGVDIPHLCHRPGHDTGGSCRACLVEVKGERALAAACRRRAEPGMEVSTASAKARKARELVLELHASDMPVDGFKWLGDDGARPHGELSQWCTQEDIRVRPELRSSTPPKRPPDLSHPAIAVHLDACIQCKRCVVACRQEQVNGVIGVSSRGSGVHISFDLGDDLGASSCVGCGECVQACPTGALAPKPLAGNQRVDREVDSVCPYCGVGCLVRYKVRDERIIAVEGREDGPANRGRLCVKGRFGLDYIHHPQRLTRPLVRRSGVPKSPDVDRDPAGWQDVFREASWDEALDLAAGGLKRLLARHGPAALAGFGSAKGSNEEAYLFQKLIRTGFRSNNVDHCTRMCHASSVAALLEGVGSGAVSNQISDVADAEFVLVIGSNPTANHPVAATWIKNAARNGAKVVVADPRLTDLAQHAWRVLQFKADTDVALLNAMLHTIIAEGLVDEAFVVTRTNNFEALRERVGRYSPEAMAPVCGIPADTIREVARAYAVSGASMILWGMGISQHVHGTDNARCLIALASITGQIGRRGTGLHPLRGQNNVQGASDAGLIPMMFPNYQRVSDEASRRWFEDFWRTPLDGRPGLTVVEVMDHALRPDDDPARVRGMYIMGENPAMSDPDLNHAREALCKLDHLVVQDIFMTETAWTADVVLPASAWPEKWGTVTNTDRMVQMGRKAVEPPGQARADLWTIQAMAQRLGLDWHYPGSEHGVEAVFEEMRQAMHAAISGISWERLTAESSVTYPCLDAESVGTPTLFTYSFPTADGRVNLVPVDLVPAAEVPDAEFPIVLITGRLLEHWHTGAMTRRASVLDTIEPAATISLNQRMCDRLGLQPGDALTVTSRRGQVAAIARVDEGTPDDTIFMPFAFREAAANLLTNSALDPHGKIPEVKYCAVRVSLGRPSLGAE